MKRLIGILPCLVLAAGVYGPEWSGQSHFLAWAAEVVPNLADGRNTISSQLSTNTTEIIRLAESGVEEEVILAYIENFQGAFELSAENVIYLKDLGIGSPVIAAMLRHDTVLREQGFQPGMAAGVTNQSTYDQKLYLSTNALPATVAQPVYVTNAPPQVTYFYNALEPYGTWVEVETLGWCWQPRVVTVDRSWRPYWHGGRWIWTDAGWYWQSEYSWGWAPFHYGRWHHHHRHGWVWFPDTVWAPAWVSWRYSDTHCGWAPLPLGAHFVIGQGWRFNNLSVGINFDFRLGPDLFTYVEIRHLHERHPHLHGVPLGHVKEIHSHTTVVNRYTLGPNNSMINHGIAVDRVSAASRSEIRKVAIRDRPAAPATAVRPDRLVREGSSEVIYRAELRPPAKPGPVVAQKIDERHPVVRPMPPRTETVAPAPRQPPPAPTTIPSRPAVPPRSPTQTAPRTQPRAGAVAPAPAPIIRPKPARRPESTPSVWQPVLNPPAGSGTGRSGTQPMPPAVPQTAPSPTPRSESPKGREQRTSNGGATRSIPSTRTPPAPGQPSGPSSTPPGSKRP